MTQHLENLMATKLEGLILILFRSFPDINVYTTKITKEDKRLYFISNYVIFVHISSGLMI